MKYATALTPVFALALAALNSVAQATPTTFQIDPAHTYPSFEADHMGGLSVWRGKFNKTAGTISWDNATKQGAVNVTIDINSVDFGLDVMNTKAKSSDLLDAAKYPTATYVGKLAGFQDGKPTQVLGDLTLHGVTKPVPLEITSLKCMSHMLLKREVCGADARATFRRDDFGMDMGKLFGFKMDITLRIQVEAIAE